jgi:putative membrane protein
MAGPLARLVLLYPVIMYSLFIGMTLGGVPLLWRMMQPIRFRSAVCMVAGVGLMIGIAAAESDRTELSREDHEQIGRMVQGGEFSLHRAYGRDVAAGLLGMSAMVLPGISGAYMLLLLGRYEQILTAISLTKDWALSGGRSGDLAALHVIVPVAIGAIISLVGVTNVLKWLLHHHARPTIGFLLGILAGSAVMLWLHAQVKGPSEYAQAGLALLIGLAVTLGIARVGAGRTPGTRYVDPNRGP